ncbi:MAG: nucleotidyltransferase domain-containing protein [Methanoregulaceae archaeon]|nr:nucleotidyltransferase domain-containing protein [Methanoregulaceae archaeon]
MKIQYDTILNRLQRLEGFSHVRFIILFGSVAEGREIPGSDIDLCISYKGTVEEASRFRVAALTELSDTPPCDIRIFEQMPLLMRLQVFAGEVLYCPDPDLLYSVAYETIRDYEAFRHRLSDYTGEKAIL